MDIGIENKVKKMGRNEEMDGVERAIKRAIGYVIFFVILLVVLFGSMYTVKSGQEGVLLTFGKADVLAREPGLHFKVPIVQKIVKFDVKTAKYEASAAAASRDLQDVSTNIALNYHLQIGDTPRVFAEMGPYYEERVIQPAVQEVVKSVAAKYTAEELITKRPDVKRDIEEQLVERIQPRGIFMESLAITNFEFSQSFTAAIEAKVVAEQEKLQAERILEKKKVEANQVIATAEGTKQANILSAEGIAKKIELESAAEAQKIQRIQAALDKSPQYIEWVKADKWSGDLPKVMMSNSGSSAFIDVTAMTE